MPPSKGPFSANIHPIIPKLSVPIPQGMCCAYSSGYVLSKKVWVLDSKMYGYRQEKRMKSPLTPQPVPLKLDSMPPSKGPFSANIHPIIPKLSAPIPEGMCIRKNGAGPLSKMHGLGSKIQLKSPLAPQPVPLKLDSMPPSKGPFSANIHPIIPKLSVPIPQGMCFLKMVGAHFENARLGAKNPLQITIRFQAGFSLTRLKLTFQRSFLHEYASDHSQLCCA